MDKTTSDANALPEKALGLDDAWKVVEIDMNLNGHPLKLWLDFAKVS